MHKALKYERDLVPGDVFGEEVRGRGAIVM
jgi:hypothetical protein